ncbi:MAG: D-sedoheptulose 7-phosphate isomerase [Desulfobacteraceae bacterium]
MKPIILESLEQSITIKQKFIHDNLDLIDKGGELLEKIFSRGSKLLIFGNGGSAADAQHIAAEFINRFQMERPPLAALSLACDTSVITSIGNDYSFDDIFAKQIKALGKKGDMALGISTSGNSPNVVKAVKTASRMGLETMGFAGKGGELKEIADTTFCVDTASTARIQECHILLAHILCDLAERRLFNG